MRLRRSFKTYPMSRSVFEGDYLVTDQINHIILCVLFHNDCNIHASIEIPYYPGVAPVPEEMTRIKVFMRTNDYTV